jgi:hypothetical protein
MQADLDMNSNDILNAGEVNVNALTIGGVALFPANTQIATTYSTQNYTGNGVTTTYAMGFNPATKANVDAYIDGVYQNQDAFNISGTNLTFTAAPPLNSAIEIKVPVNVTDLVASDSQQITYTQGGAGSVNRTVQSRLRDFVSVKDFGAVGDGVTDDTAAIQAALDSGAEQIYFPAGEYLTDSLVASSPVRLVGENRSRSSGNVSSSGTAAFRFSGTGVLLTLNASYSAVENFLISLPSGASFAGKTAIQTNAPIMSFKNLRISPMEIGIHGATNHFYMTYEDVWQSASKMLIDAADNNVVIFNRCTWASSFEIHNAVNVTFNNCDFGDVGAGVSASGRYYFLNPITVSINDPYVESRTVRSAVNWIKFYVDAAGIASGAGRFVTISNGYYRGEGTGGSSNIDTVYLFDGPIYANISGGYYRNLDHIVETANSAEVNIFGDPQRTGGVSVLKSGSINPALFFNTDIRFNSNTADPVGDGVVGASYGIGGTNINADGSLLPANPVHTTRKASQGTGVNPTQIHNELYSGAVKAGHIGIHRDERMEIYGLNQVRLVGNNRSVVLDGVNDEFTPSADDNVISNGSASFRWSVVYAGTGTINTSDKNEKQDIADLSASELLVAAELKGLVKKFRFRDAVAIKGKDARTHVGVIAQDVEATFAKHGLDASEYGMFCRDTWVDEDTGEERTRLGVRYDQVLAFVIAAM